MHKLHLGFAVLCSLIGSALSGKAVLADPGGMGPAEKTPSRWLRFSGDQGLLTDLPAPSAKDLVAQIRDLQAKLKRYEEGLSEAVAENALGAKDALIAVVMPGGLLYATVKKRKHDRAKSNLAAVNTDLAALNRDLLVFRAAAGEVMVAQLP